MISVNGFHCVTPQKRHFHPNHSTNLDLFHRKHSDGFRSNEESGPSTDINRSSMHHSAEPSNIFHRRHSDGYRSNEESDDRVDDRCQANVCMFSQVHVDQETLANPICCDCVDPESLIAVNKSEEISKVFTREINEKLRNENLLSGDSGVTVNLTNKYVV